MAPCEVALVETAGLMTADVHLVVGLHWHCGGSWHCDGRDASTLMRITEGSGDAMALWSFGFDAPSLDFHIRVRRGRVRSGSDAFVNGVIVEVDEMRGI